MRCLSDLGERRRGGTTPPRLYRRPPGESKTRPPHVSSAFGASWLVVAPCPLLGEDAEADLYAALGTASETVRPLLDDRNYTEALKELAGLRSPIDRFFDDVMVMVDDESLRNNRLALLGELRALFLDVADISRLSIA